MTRPRTTLSSCLALLLCVAVVFARGEETKQVACETTAGKLTIEVHPEWAPLGAARFLELVESGFFVDVALFRVVPNFLVQFGIAADPEVTKKWQSKGNIMDDPSIGTPVKRGTIAFAGSGQNSRTTQMWIAFQDSAHLGKAFWETPFAQVTEGMDVVDRFYSGYGDMEAFGGHCPDSGKMSTLGNSYVKKEFPQMDYITSCRVLGQEAMVVAAADQAGTVQQAELALADAVVEPDAVRVEPNTDSEDLGLDGHEVQHKVVGPYMEGMGPIGMSACLFIAAAAFIKIAFMMLDGGSQRGKQRHQ
uniref:peptidylprolyl isomerase n=1 Tax=Tetraselmis chuii TaxID=63592 RepID=A0A7S1T0Y9_9CHLO|mmetsp:Transcript_39181/g.70174  ORF Transcript_39181/g.70174 Transcript_39181/m.70174 type:complete len:304 (+) Transcript_39181:207-1118(+)